MSEDVKKGAASKAQVSNFNFIVRFGDQDFYFTEVSGLASEHQVKDFRENEPRFSGDLKTIPVLKNGILTLKRGLFKGNDMHWTKIAGRGLEVQQENMTISLMDEAGRVARRWKIHNAFPVKIQAADFKAGGNEVAIETMELSHEGITVEE